MPKEVNPRERLEKIAEATLQVGEREGPGAITIRSVAGELDGSTALITNYVGTRADLILNVIMHVRRQWDSDMEAAIDGLGGADRLEALVLWAVTTDSLDLTMRRLWVDLAAKAGPESASGKALAAIAPRERDQIRSAIEGTTSSQPDPEVLDVEADLLYLMIRGFYFLSVENPDAWTEDRARQALLYALGLLEERATARTEER